MKVSKQEKIRKTFYYSPEKESITKWLEAQNNLSLSLSQLILDQIKLNGEEQDYIELKLNSDS